MYVAYDTTTFEIYEEGTFDELRQYKDDYTDVKTWSEYEDAVYSHPEI